MNENSINHERFAYTSHKSLKKSSIKSDNKKYCKTCSESEAPTKRRKKKRQSKIVKDILECLEMDIFVSPIRTINSEKYWLFMTDRESRFTWCSPITKEKKLFLQDLSLIDENGKIKYHKSQLLLYFVVKNLFTCYPI